MTLTIPSAHRLEGKVAVITGASRGIGRDTALLFAEHGATVVCAARTVNEGDHRLLTGSLSTTVDQIHKIGGTAEAIQCDVSQEEDCLRLIAETEAKYGQVDVLINNAALNYYIKIADYPTNRWNRAFAVNVHGPFMLMRTVMPGMVERGSGAIVNLSSMGAVGPGRGPYNEVGRGGTMYGATKAALERLTQGAAQELADSGVAITCVSPSVGVPTEGTVFHGLRKALDDPEGESQEVMAASILLLATEPAESVNGRVTYSQQILKEFGWLDDGEGYGLTIKGSGYSEI